MHTRFFLAPSQGCLWPGNSAGAGPSSGELNLLVIIAVKNHMCFSCLFREKVESDLIFLGLLILENRLKEETKPVLEELISARIRTVMITGIQQSGNGGS